MWRSVRNFYIGNIEKCVGEYEITIAGLFPYGKCKMKIYKKQNDDMYGKLDIKKKINGKYREVISIGRTKKEVMNNMLNILNVMYELHPMGLKESDIEYLHYWEF